MSNLDPSTEYLQLVIGGSQDGKRPEGLVPRKILTASGETYTAHMLGCVKADGTIMTAIIWAIEGRSDAEVFEDLIGGYKRP